LFVLARASAGLADATIQHDLMYRGQIRTWLDRPLWTMQPVDTDRFFGEALRAAAPHTKIGEGGSLSIFFRYLELRHKVEVYHRTVTSPGFGQPRPAGDRRALAPPVRRSAHGQHAPDAVRLAAHQRTPTPQELVEDHAVAVSHLDATPYRATIKHHVYMDATADVRPAISRPALSRLARSR